MIADSQVVLQAEGLQHHAVPHREGQSQLLTGTRPCGTPPSQTAVTFPPGPQPHPGRAPAAPRPLHKNPPRRKPNLH